MGKKIGGKLGVPGQNPQSQLWCERDILGICQIYSEGWRNLGERTNDAPIHFPGEELEHLWRAGGRMHEGRGEGGGKVATESVLFFHREFAGRSQSGF